MPCACEFKYYFASIDGVDVLARNCTKCKHISYQPLALLDQTELDSLYKVLSVLQSLKSQTL